MEATKKPKAEEPRKVLRPYQRPEPGGKWIVWLAVLAVGGLFTLVGLLVAKSGGKDDHLMPSTATRVVRRPLPPPVPIPEPEEPKSSGREDDKSKEGGRSLGHLTGQKLRDQINKEFEAAKRRAELYAGQERWADAIAAIERMVDRYDDEELRLRCEPEIRILRDKAKAAFKAKMAEADRLIEEARFPEARKLLDAVVERFGRPEFVEPARERVKDIGQREDAHAAATYARLMAAIDERLPAWRFEEALAEVRKLKFDRPNYQALHAARVERIRELVDLKNRIIQKIIHAKPRMTKRAYNVPGIPGELAIADADCIYTVTDQGEEKIPWARLGAEAAARLAIAAGDPESTAHRLAVVRFLIELRHFARAAEELKQAKEMGANIEALAAELASRQAAAPKPGEAPKKAEP